MHLHERGWEKYGGRGGAVVEMNTYLAVHDRAPESICLLCSRGVHARVPHPLTRDDCSPIDTGC